MADDNRSGTAEMLASTVEGAEYRCLPPSLIAIVAAFITGSGALLVLALQPVLLGALVDKGVLTAAQLGWTATAEVLALAAASAIAPRLLRLGRARVTLALATLCLVATDQWSGSAANFAAILSLRTVAGLAEGLLMGLTIVTMLAGREPERLNGLFLGFSAIPQAAGVYLLSISVIPRSGGQGAFTVLAVSAAISGLAAMVGVIPRKARHVAVESAGTMFEPHLLSAFLAIFLQNAAIGVAWSYIERIAQMHSLAPQTVALALSGNICLQIVGAMLVAWKGNRVGFLAALCVGTTAQAAILGFILVSQSGAIFVLGVFSFGLLWLAMSPFQLRLLIRLDPSRRAAGASVAVTLLGLAFGPFAGAFCVAAGGVEGAVWAGIVMFLAAVPVYLIAAVRTRSTSQLALAT